MDGVLADFDGAIIKKFESKKLWDNRWDEVDPELFLKLEKMPDADQLVDYVRGMFDIHLLTAIPKKGRFEKSRVGFRFFKSSMRLFVTIFNDASYVFLAIITLFTFVFTPKINQK